MTLESSRLFGQLSPDDLTVLGRSARNHQFAAGQQIFREGDAGDGVYFVTEGLVEISTEVAKNSRQVFSDVQPGDIFGEMAVIDDKPRSACAVAKKPTAVLFIPRAEVLKLVERSPALALGLLREISRRLREFDRRYLREVLQAERLAVVGRFARSIIHDLKNPLNIIGLTAEVAGLSQSTPETRAQAVATIRQQVERINELVSEVLDFTQGAAPELVLPPMNYAEYVQHVIEEIRPEAALKGVTLEAPHPAPEVALLLNPKRLRRVFNNLIHNAAEAMPSGGKVFLRFELKPSEVVTEIEDTGPGIALEIAEHLFEPFASYGKSEGTGLGLSICKRIIEDHHGWIAARNETGHGAIFSFGLPLPREPKG